MSKTTFNPTMVRLQPPTSLSKLRDKKLSIPLWCDCNPPPHSLIPFVEGFQSHYGAIATQVAAKYCLQNLLTFNPTMVRLQLSTKLYCWQPVWFFQSHYGAIATSPFSTAGITAEAAFNPTMVRLQLVVPLRFLPQLLHFQSHYGAIATKKRESKSKVVAGLSIPLWCDCNNALSQR